MNHNVKCSRLFVSVLFMLLLINCNEKTNSIPLSPQSFKDSISKPNVQVIDVRTLKEFSLNHIDGAINIDFFSTNFADSVKLLNHEKPIFIYCKSGKRSAKSISVFKKEGFKKIYELKGGILNY